ncbi:hypothetical protein J2Z40_002954 [Cytobacillus eiseniae]|uniref:DUF5667 domain-containing protein n=1 Tax=Cytobacillus eiseniae TaxID=762947 RepID=A0ABS4RHK4_9BACI|nr:hypothetical protein [Cytobacillus eiseniae]MBP2242380.1 hypothetical protein [Cytobacillus eiseniae]
MGSKSLEYKRKRWRQRKRFLKTFTSSVAISSLLLGGARITGPTYGAFTSIQDQGIGVEACFIFPKEVEKRRDLTYEWKEEAIQRMQQVLDKVTAVDVAGLTEKVDLLITPEDEEASTEAPPEVSFDVTTIEGLQAQQESLRAEIAAIQETIKANEQKGKEFEAVIAEIVEMQKVLQEILTTDFPEAEELALEKLKKIEETLEFIESIVELAIKECKYDPLFFEEIIEDIELYKKELTDFLELDFAEMKEKTVEQIEQFTLKIEEVNAAMETLLTQNEELLAKIAKLEGMITAIDEQISVFEEILKKKDGLMEVAALLAQKLNDSENLTAEQIQYLMDKLAEIHAALENPDLTADISGLDQAIADIEEEMSKLEEIQVQKNGLKEGTSLLSQKILESTTLTEEQKQALLEKLAELNAAIDGGDFAEGTAEFEKALADMEEEIKQREEEAKKEQEKLEEEQELEDEEDEDPQNPAPKRGIDELIQQITDSTTLTDEQKQELLDKLAELGESPTDGDADYEKALSDIEEEMKKKEEEAKQEQEEKEKEETEEEEQEGADEEKEDSETPAEGDETDPPNPGEEKPVNEDENNEEEGLKEKDKEQTPTPQPKEEQPAEKRDSESSQLSSLLMGDNIQPRINQPKTPNKNLSVENTRLDMRTEESSIIDTIGSKLVE